jgi:hypothetical protein
MIQNNDLFDSIRSVWVAPLAYQVSALSGAPQLVHDSHFGMLAEDNKLFKFK